MFVYFSSFIIALCFSEGFLCGNVFLCRNLPRSKSWQPSVSATSTTSAVWWTPNVFRELTAASATESSPSLWVLIFLLSHDQLKQQPHLHLCCSSEQKERTEALVINPLTQLLAMFAGPYKLIQKRFDKLLDYDNCKERAERLKDRRVQEELRAARNNYEALNAQLLDELPKFLQTAEEMFLGCVTAFAQAQKDFMRTTMEELKPLLQVLLIHQTEKIRLIIKKNDWKWGNKTIKCLPKQSFKLKRQKSAHQSTKTNAKSERRWENKKFKIFKKNKISRKIFIFACVLFLFQQFSNKGATSGNLIAQFQEEYNCVLRLLQSFSFCPENLPLTTSTKKPVEKKTLDKQTSKKQLQGPVSSQDFFIFEYFSKVSPLNCPSSSA